MKQLDRCWETETTNIVSLVAMAGMGKSAIVHYWLDKVMRPARWRGAERVFGWSFFSQGWRDERASSEEFFTHAFTAFGEQGTMPASPRARGERLAQLVKKKKTLMILDGLEPLQHPPGPDGGKLKDRGVESLLRGLADGHPGLCIVTTRLEVAGFEAFGASVESIEPRKLEPEDGADLLSTLLENDRNELAEVKAASGEFGGHPLALTLLGSYIRLVRRGDIRARDSIGPLEEEEQHGGHARRVLASYEKWFGESPELSILRLLGLFDRPADGAAITQLREPPPIPGVTDELQDLSEADWQKALSNLRKAKLLAPANRFQPSTLDAHPLIREHFAQRVKEKFPKGWAQGNKRLSEYYKSTVRPQRPKTLEEISQLHAAIMHACKAGLHVEAYKNIYQERVLHGAEGQDGHYSWKKLGMYGGDLAALSGFFKKPWKTVHPSFSDADQAFILIMAGFYLRALGRLEDAKEPMHEALHKHETLAKKDPTQWREAGNDADNLAQLFIVSGDLQNARRYAEKGITLISKTHQTNDRWGVIFRATLGNVLHYLGDLPAAEATFREAEAMWLAQDANRPCLQSASGYRYSDLLLDEGKHPEVLARAGKWVQHAEHAGDLLDIAFAYLSKARAYLCAGKLTQASIDATRAVDGLRDATFQDPLVHGLLCQATVSRKRKHFTDAWGSLKQATSICTRAGMLLLEADCHLEWTRIHLAKGDREQARDSLDTAKNILVPLALDGYRRRDHDLAELERKLG